jgi:hypothetical protein
MLNDFLMTILLTCFLGGRFFYFASTAFQPGVNEIVVFNFLTFHKTVFL